MTKHIKNKLLYILIFNTYTNGANNYDNSALLLAEPEVIEKIDQLLSGRANVVLTTGSILYTCILLAVMNLIWNFVDADEKVVFYVDSEVQQEIYENTQSVFGFVISLLHLVLMCFIIDFKKKFIEWNLLKNLEKKTKHFIMYIIRSFAYLSTLTVFSMLIACAATTSGGMEDITYGPNSQIIPNKDILINECWYCNPTGSSAAPNVWTHFNRMLQICIDSDVLGQPANCVWDFGWYAFEGGFTHAYFLLIWYSLIIINMFFSFWKLRNIDKQIELLKKNEI